MEKFKEARFNVEQAWINWARAKPDLDYTQITELNPGTSRIEVVEEGNSEKVLCTSMTKAP